MDIQTLKDQQNAAQNAATDPNAPKVDPTLVLHLSEAAWNGDAQITVDIDGVQVLGPTSITALNANGATQDITIPGINGAILHNVTIHLVNGASGGSLATSRDLYVTGATFNETAVPFTATLYGANGATSAEFQVGSGVTAQKTAFDTASTAFLQQLSYQASLTRDIINQAAIIGQLQAIYDPSKPLGGVPLGTFVATYAPALQAYINDMEAFGTLSDLSTLYNQVLSTSQASLDALVPAAFTDLANITNVGVPPLTAAQTAAKNAAFALGQPYVETWYSFQGRTYADEASANLAYLMNSLRGYAVASNGGGSVVVEAPPPPPPPVQLAHIYFPLGVALNAQISSNVMFAALQSQNGDVQRLTFDPSKGIQILLQPNLYYTVSVLDPITGYVGQEAFKTANSGIDTLVPTVGLMLDPSAILADGLTAKQAFILGLDPTQVSNIVPGMTDRAALQAGLFNAASLASTTGAVASGLCKDPPRRWCSPVRPTVPPRGWLMSRPEALDWPLSMSPGTPRRSCSVSCN